MQEKTRRFQALVSSGDVLYPGAAPCVERLAAAWPLGIASGALRHEIELMLRGGGLHDAFRFIVAAGDTDRTKPAPDPYLRAAELHGVAAGGLRRHRGLALGPPVRPIRRHDHHRASLTPTRVTRFATPTASSIRSTS